MRPLLSALGTDRAQFRELGAAVAEALAACFEGTVEALAGDYEAAEHALGEGCASFESMGEKGLLSTVVAQHGQALLGLGRIEEAAAAAARSRELTATDDIVSQMLWRQVEAKVLARRGQHDEAIRLATEAVTLGEPTDAIVIAADALLDLGEVLDLAGKPEEAAGALNRALALYGRKGNLVMAARASERLAARRAAP